MEKKMKVSGNVASWLIVLLVISLVGLLYIYYPPPANGKTPCTTCGHPPTVDVTIPNPYSLDVSLEVKCDWNKKMNVWAFYKKYKIRSQRSVVISIPNHLKNCEVWPTVHLW
jgi:hypothetical protein